MLLQALKQNAGRTRVAVGKSVPAPIDGWDAISPLAQMKPTRAVQLDNWFPQPGYVEIRGGYTSWATGVGSAAASVNSVMAYNGLTTASDKLFAAAGAAIYDVTANATATATSATGFNSSKWQYVNYTTSAGTHYLIICNGADDVREWDGSAWTTPTITGVTSSSTINLNVFKKFVWGTLIGSMDAYWLPLDSISGAGTKFPLGSVMGEGGYLVGMTTWTRDGGNGPDDYAVFISSRGQVAVYSGSNPASDFSLVGVYKIPPPIGYRCFTRVAGDAAIVTIGGVVPLSKALTQDTAAEAGIALTLRINNAITAYARDNKGKFGWEFKQFPLRNAALLNIPTTENSVAVQAVINVLTGAWCRFTGWNVNTFETFKDDLYAGSNTGSVYKMWNGSRDGSNSIIADGQSAYNYFGAPGIDKRFTAIQPLITSDSTLIPSIGLSTDFKDNAVVTTPSVTTAATSLYDACLYDTTAVYAIEGGSSADWTTASGIGQCASLHFRQDTNSASNLVIQFNGYNLTYETGEFY